MWKTAIKEFADAHGIVLIATGNDTSAGIFDIAEEHYSVNSADHEAMKRLIKENRIDGVYMGGSEPVITQASIYLNELGLPCYCNHEQWEFLQDKGKFKTLCQQFGLPCVPRYELNSKHIDYPVITKPTDGCGSNGFSVCRTPEELAIGYNLAQKASPTGSVLIEKFVKNDSVVVFYTFSNGQLFFSGLEDKYPVKYESHESYVAGMHLFESRFANEFRNRFDDKLQQMFNYLGIKEGSLWIEVFHDSDNYYFNEVGFRYSGSVSIYPVDYFYGINQVASDIHYALTGKSCIKGHATLIPSKVPRKKHYCIFNVHMLPGTIKTIKGVDSLRNEPGCVFIADTKHVGDTVSETGTVAQVFAFIHFVFDSLDELTSFINKIYQTIHVESIDNQEMLLNRLNLNEKTIVL